MQRPNLPSGSNPAIETVLIMGLISTLSWVGRLLDMFEPFVLLPPLTDGWWQIPLSVYAHSSPTHFLANAVVVLLVGGIISINATRLRFHLFFLVTGAVAGALNVLIPGVTGESIAILGASGAAFGLIGYFLTANRISNYVFSDSSRKVAGVVFFAIALGFTVITSGVNVGNLAHFSGIVIGGIAGYFNLLRENRLVPRFSP